jgi:hypothetical protein
MATKITIGGKTTSIPNVYGQIKSGVVNPASPLDFGNVIIIDDGSFGTASYTAIGGIEGENKQGLDAVVPFSEIFDTYPLIWDSELMLVLKSLFKPSKTAGTVGANKVYYIQASTTKSAKTILPFTKGNLSLKTKFEGQSLNAFYQAKSYSLATANGTLAAPTTIDVYASQKNGVLVANSYYYKITALNSIGETLASVEKTGVITSSVGSIYLSWVPISGATSYKVYKGIATDSQNKYFETNSNNRYSTYSKYSNYFNRR